MRRFVGMALWLSACVDLTPPSELGSLSENALDGARPPEYGDAPAGADAKSGPGDVADVANPIDMANPVDAPPLVNGKLCSANGQCQSSLCVDGVCCNADCRGLCQSCSLAGTEGTCTAVPAGQDPRDVCLPEPTATCGRDGFCDGKGACRRYPANTECAVGRCTGATEYAASTCDGNGLCQPGSARSCAPNVCAADSCGSACSGQGDCQTGFYCNAGQCTLRRAPGTACTAAVECASNNCVDGLCCSTPCGQICYACNLPSAPGTCTPVPDGQPDSACPAEAQATCGRTGTCNGSGSCRLEAAGVSCGAAVCNGSTETAASTCDGSGVCVAGTSRDCSPYLCSATVCGTSCNTTAQCHSGFYCASGSCVPFGAPPVLHWKFDEPNGTTALDASGNNFNGTYTGTTGTPSPSSMVPPVSFTDPASRAFVAANRHAVVRSPAPPATRPSNNLTVSLWYRTTLLDTGHNPPASSDALSNGDNYFLRIRAADIAFTRLTSGGYLVCFAAVSGHLDGRWHHIAGVASPAGTKVYFDGVEKCSNTTGANLSYSGGPDLWVGRHGNGQTQWDFDGNIDDVRIYGRALPPAEVAALAAGF
jgi:hypothetical protein